MLDVHPQLLRALRAVLESGSFTAAAERLGFTQSALSKQVAALEAAAGAPLFERGPRGVRPTAAAVRLGARAVAVLDELDAAERELATGTAGPAGTAVLGGFPATALHLVPRTIAAVRRARPGVEVAFVEAATPALVRRLRSARLDLALLGAGPGLQDLDLRGLRTEPVPSGGLHVAVPRQHRLAGAVAIAPGDLAGETWIVGRAGRGQPQFGVWPTLPPPPSAVELGEWSARLGFVAAGLGLTTVPSLVVPALPPGVVAVRVDDPGWSETPMLLAAADRLSPAGEAVREALLVQAARLVAAVAARDQFENTTSASQRVPRGRLTDSSVAARPV